jgi:hypothetical protein
MVTSLTKKSVVPDHTKEVHENHTNQCIIARQQGKYIFLVLINSCFAAMRVYQAANS